MAEAVTKYSSCRSSSSLQIETMNDSIASSTGLSAQINGTLMNKNRQVCWRLPEKLEPSIESLENQIFLLINAVRITRKASLSPIRALFSSCRTSFKRSSSTLTTTAKS